MKRPCHRGKALHRLLTGRDSICVRSSTQQHVQGVLSSRTDRPHQGRHPRWSKNHICLCWRCARSLQGGNVNNHEIYKRDIASTTSATPCTRPTSYKEGGGGERGFPIAVQQRGEKRGDIPPETSYSLDAGAAKDGFTRVAAAAARTVVPRSFVLAATRGDEALRGSETKRAESDDVLKVTLSPSFHISVMIVSPG